MAGILPSGQSTLPNGTTMEATTCKDVSLFKILVSQSADHV